MTLIRTVKNGSKYGPARIKQVKDIQCRKKLSIWYIHKLFICYIDKTDFSIPNIDFFLSVPHVEKICIRHIYKKTLLSI